MTDPTIELLRAFRADVPPPNDEQRARALRRAQASTARRHGRLLSPLRRRMLVLGGAATVAAAVLLVLAAPWAHGPASLTQAQAANVVRHAIAAASPATDAIFHERYEVTGVPWAGAGRAARVSNELWQQSGGERRFRATLQTIVPTVSIELGSAGGAPGLALYDPRTNGIYRIPDGYGVTPLGPNSTASGDIAERLRNQLAGGRLAEGWVVSRTTLDGRGVYRISNLQPSRSGPSGITYYVDADTYAPVQIEEPGWPRDQPGGPRSKPGRGVSIGPNSPASLTVTRILRYEHLDPSNANRAQLDLRTAHPTATELPLATLRADVKERVGGATPSVSATPAPSPPTRLTVDPQTGSIGRFRIGDNLLALSPVLTPPLVNFPVLPGNLEDAAVAGSADRNGIFVVTFHDAAEEHSTSAYLMRPFRTTRGDVNGAGGTTLDEFLAHWPDHGAPTPKTGAGGITTTTVAVGKATFYFGADERLSAVAIGEGDAASYAGFGVPPHP